MSKVFNKKILVVLAVIFVLGSIPMTALADTHVPLDEGISVELNEISPDWVYYENGWEDESLLNYHNIPTHPPEVANRTPSGVWNLTFTLNVTYGRGQYWAYMYSRNNDTYVLDVFGNATGGIDGMGKFYNDTGSFNLTIDTEVWGTGWFSVWVNAMVAEPWLSDSSRSWGRWMYIDNSLTVPSPTLTLPEPESLGNPEPATPFQIYLSLGAVLGLIFVAAIFPSKNNRLKSVEA